MFEFSLAILAPAALVVYATLGFLSVITLTVAAYKTLQFARLGVGRTKKAEAVVETWLDGKIDAAMDGVAHRKSVLARVLFSVMSGLRERPDTPEFAEELGRQTALVELATMSEKMRLLEMVVQAAPMLGLLGTVIGMIDAFSVLAVTQGTVDPASLAGGIWTALSTTAVGLAIALVAYFIATWFESRIDNERNAIETFVSMSIHGRVEPAKAGR